MVPFMTRREFLAGGVGAFVTTRMIPLALTPALRRPFKFAVITDLHHGLAKDAMSRLEAFATAVRKRRDLDLVVQLGDFNYGTPEAAECTKLFQSLPRPKLHVLGNHDMDKVDKDTAMRAWGMKSRYGAYDFGDYRFVVLDLNHFKKEGRLHAYDKGNYFTPGASASWADPEQLDWLKRELHASRKPVVLLGHQPLGFADPGKEMPPEQAEIVSIVSEAKRANPRGAVAVSLFGHLHIDRLERVDGVPYYCVNSASYFWGGAMYAYSQPLFALMELTTDGNLRMEGVQGSFRETPPANTDAVIGRSASILDRTIYSIT